jgi:hypothetical protein
MDNTIFKQSVIFPYIIREVLYDSKFLKQHGLCRKCTSKDCLSQTHVQSYICNKGFNCYYLTLNGENIIINGLISDQNNTIKTGTKSRKLRYLVLEENMKNYLLGLSEINSGVIEEFNNDFKEKFSLLHDVRTSYALAFANVEKFILKQNGYNFQSKLANCDQEIIDFYDSLDLVNSQLKLIDIVVNPKLLNAGIRSESNLFKLANKLIKLFEVRSKHKNINFRIYSECNIPDKEFHDSILFIPMVLIENAIKYSEKDTTVVLNFDMEGDVIIFSISSKGEMVDDAHEAAIFQKSVRGENALNSQEYGLGLGLWIANLVLQNHNGTIVYEKEAIDFSNIGYNKFIVNV